jgi:alpha-L-arabinofuranosidase
MNGITRLHFSTALGTLLIAASTLAADDARITVQADRPGHRIAPTLWGIFFEDINHSADGGIYPELVRNRSFEDSEKPERWSLETTGSTKGEIAINDTKPVDPFNRRSLRLKITEAGDGKARLINEGYWGMNIVKGAQYRFSLSARCADGFQGPLVVTMEGKDGHALAGKNIEGIGDKWKSEAFDFTASDSDPQARLVISATGKGTVWLDMVSIMPKATWKNHGLRPDLAEMLMGLKPAFVRFPGGCWVEGNELKTSYRWKETIGDISHRKPLWNIWAYYATHGLGYLEYLTMCEDLGAEPLFVINCGMSHQENVPMDQMGPLVQDALDAIEYANGPVTSVWGGLRAKHGHPTPFNLKYMEIGNENGGPAYLERYALMVQAIQKSYPEMHLVANDWGGIPTGSPVEIIDEHYYSTPDFFIQQAGKYDRYDRKGPKVYVGEYAVTQNGGQGNLRAAVGEAAFMTGMERNSDVVVMASYAPLFVNVNYKKWNPDLINFDSSRVYGIPSYYVQKMFAENRGDVVLPASIEFASEAASEPHPGKIGVGTWLTQAEFKDIKVTHGDQVLFESDFAKGAEGWNAVRGDWKAVDGAYRQTSAKENMLAMAGDASWTDYTYTLKARKLGGAEGFLILFQARDDQNWVWWNIGGWGNRQHGIERSEGGGKSVMGSQVSGSVQTGKWYDVRIEIKGNNIQCFLDGKLIQDVVYQKSQSLHVSASQALQSNEVILKVVNSSRDPQNVGIQLRGMSKLGAEGRMVVLTSAKPEDENSITEPTKVVPVQKTFACPGPEFDQVFPGNSVSVLRLKTEK